VNILQSLAGMTELRITGADIAAALDTLTKNGIQVVSSAAENDVTYRLTLYRNDCKKAVYLLEKRGNEVEITRKRGIYWYFQRLICRPVLVLGCALLFCMALYMPTRIYFVRVEGNETIPANQILEAADGCGIRFGASRREVRSEQMKNRLLHNMPQLQWAGVNTYGCVAVITVKERTDPEAEFDFPEVGSIVASRDGIILSCTATSGNLLCRPGQAVRAGEVLISGFTDCGLCIQATLADGEVYAQTERQIRAVIPTEYVKCIAQETGVKKISLIIGKKRINLWKDSGICDTTCGRMYKEYYMTLPGGFQLPIGIAVENCTAYETVPETLPAQTCEEILSGFAQKDLSRQMIAGSIVQKEEQFREEEGIYVLKGTYICTEMIGRVRQEQIGEYNGENN